MNQKRILLLVSAALLALILGACGGADSGASSAVLTEAANIYSQSLTETAGAASPTPEASATEKPDKPTKTPEPTETPTVSGTPPTATLSPTVQPITGGTASTGTGCLRASFEYETYPDGTQITVEKLFTKLWRLKNIGTCPWTASFSAVWVQGQLFSADSVTLFTDVTIYPGEYAMVEVDMVAPKPPGRYKGYWMLRSDQGNLFGTGVRGTEWFWIDIETVPDKD
ncbi:MAG TPA: NBR1-Ig-like domain-containing protein [Anaerolineales bacterium]|nr:NBR1-Ig-like domain-containing protein [Anaerolineales bacterium]HLE73995.1 NBR1-Ig-like domain-containing protein [Anaerolineales bacterium]